MSGSAVFGSFNTDSEVGFLTNPPEIVFCDFDGPIMDVSERYYNTYKLGLRETQDHFQGLGESVHLHILTKEQFWQMKQDRTPDPEIALRSGLQDSQIDFFLNRVRELVNHPELLAHDQIQPGVRWALNLLHTQDVKLVLVTLRCQQQVKALLEQHGLLHLFTNVWGSTDVDAAYRNQAQHKTHLLQQAWDQVVRQDQPPQSSWMVGDTEADVIAGQTLGIPTVALTCGVRSRSYLERFEPTQIHCDLLSVTHYLTERSSAA